MSRHGFEAMLSYHSSMVVWDGPIGLGEAMGQGRR